MQSKHRKFNTTANPLCKVPLPFYEDCYFISSKATDIADVIACSQIKKLPNLDFLLLPSGNRTDGERKPKETNLQHFCKNALKSELIFPICVRHAFFIFNLLTILNESSLWLAFYIARR